MKSNTTPVKSEKNDNLDKKSSKVSRLFTYLFIFSYLQLYNTVYLLNEIFLLIIQNFHEDDKMYRDKMRKVQDEVIKSK